MRISINKNILESMLIALSPYLEKKDLSAITSHILINVNNGSLNIEATDYEIGLNTTSKNIQILDEGNATANGKKLLNIIKILKDGDVALETVGDFLFIKQKNSKFKLPMFNANEFPSFPEIGEKAKFDINSSRLVRSIKKINPAIDTNNPKYELNGALIDIKNDKINLVSTDTKRLTLVEIEHSGDKDLELIIPKKAILEIQKIFFDEIEIFYDEKMLIAKSDNFTFFTKLINGTFPEYNRIIPKEIRNEITLPKDSMIEAIKQISIVSQDLRITFHNEYISFESLNEDNVEAKTQIEENIENLKESFFINTNVKHMLDFLSNIEKNQFTLGYNDKSLPFVLKSDNFITIVLPIMI